MGIEERRANVAARRFSIGISEVCDTPTHVLNLIIRLEITDA